MYTATYQAAPTGSFSAKVNFQDGTSQGFTGYLADTGLAYGSRGGFTYGWNADNTATARNRNATNSPDERYDTLNHLQKPSNPNAFWEIAVPNGTYTVRVVAGDPGFFDSVFRINVEGVLAIDGTPTTSQRWFDNTVTVTVSDGRLTVSSAAGASNNKISFIDISPAAAAPAAFQQDGGADGLVSIEAENFDANVSQGGKSWTAYAATGFSGTGALQAMANTGVNNDTGYVTNSPRLDYRINFVKTGVHHVWIRGVGLTGSDDSVHVGLDGQVVTTADRISGLATGYGWTKNTMDGVVATVNVTTPGVHVLNLWMREDGTVVDKIVLTTSASYTPTGTGPTESSRTGGASAIAAFADQRDGTGQEPAYVALSGPAEVSAQEAIPPQADTGEPVRGTPRGDGTGQQPRFNARRDDGKGQQPRFIALPGSGGVSAEEEVTQLAASRRMAPPVERLPELREALERLVDRLKQDGPPQERLEQLIERLLDRFFGEATA
jgi:hypothetical protein